MSEQCGMCRKTFASDEWREDELCAFCFGQPRLREAFDALRAERDEARAALARADAEAATIRSGVLAHVNLFADSDGPYQFLARDLRHGLLRAVPSLLATDAGKALLVEAWALREVERAARAYTQARDDNRNTTMEIIALGDALDAARRKEQP